jgi:hypothetical protein
MTRGETSALESRSSRPGQVAFESSKRMVTPSTDATRAGRVRLPNQSPGSRAERRAENIKAVEEASKATMGFCEIRLDDIAHIAQQSRQEVDVRGVVDSVKGRDGE